MNATETTPRQGIIILLKRIRRALAVGLACVGGGFLLLLLVLVCLNAVTRFFGLPLRGAVESSGLLGALAAALALGYAQIHHNHITGGSAFARLPRSVRHGLDLLAQAAGVLFFALAAWELADLALFTLESGETVDGVGELYPWLILATVPGFAGQALIVALTMCITLLHGEQ